jgi:hypothetical protein
VARYAGRKGHSFRAFLALGLIVSWVIAWIVALLVTDKREPIQATAAPAADDHLDRLKKLTELRDAGALTREEFETEKAKILGSHS